MRLVTLVVLASLFGCSKSDHLTIFAAASMAQALDGLREPFARTHPGWELRTELSGSRVACRKVADEGRAADLVVVADRELIDTLLIPTHARFSMGFASNSLVLARAPGSTVDKAILSGTPWQTALNVDGVRIGIADPQLAPVGYRALMALELNDMIGEASLRVGSAITRRLTPRNIRDDAAKLSAALETASLDAAFVYESEALQHGLAYTKLDPAIDFSDPTRADWYAKVSHDVAGVTIHGSPSVFAFTLPLHAEHPELAVALAKLLLSPEGQAIARDAHLTPLSTTQVNGEPPAALQ